MGYLNNSVVEIDAILTKKGRQILAANPNAFKITKFALADDEVDYRLWNPNHSSGTSYYGEVIENMPVLEASPNEDQQLKYKLITMDRATVYIPTISIGSTSVQLLAGQDYTIVPQTINIPNGNNNLGFTATIADNSVAELSVPSGYTVNTGTARGTQGLNEGDSGSITVVGKRFKIKAKTLYDSNGHTTTITVTGNETGGRVTLSLYVYGFYLRRP